VKCLSLVDKGWRHFRFNDLRFSYLLIVIYCLNNILVLFILLLVYISYMLIYVSDLLLISLFWKLYDFMFEIII
jgi:hypothetical protein